MRTNTRNTAPRTHEGGPAVITSPLEQLRRTVLACLLWESNFYEDGEAVAERIARLVQLCYPSDVMALAVEARENQRLRHVPLLLMRELARHHDKPQFADTLARVIQRADELAEFLALYWKDRKQPLSAQVKRGLAKAFGKFDAYALAKYNRDNAVKLRDVLFMVHAKPKDEAQAAIWKQLVNGTLPAPDTWEVALSGGADKRETFERLISEKKLGYMALLRNLRNMHEAGVDSGMVGEALIEGAAKSKALPFRFVAAARAVPYWEMLVDEAMQRALTGMERLPGETVVLVDVSGSMDGKLSAKSDLTRLDAACALAVLVRGIAEQTRVFTFSDGLVEVPARSGMALVDAIARSQHHHGTYLGGALRSLADKVKKADRIIVITDEQSADDVGTPHCKGYIVNVANHQNGVGYGPWMRVNGWSEAVVQYIQAVESSDASEKKAAA